MKTLDQFVKDNEGKFLEVAGSSNAKFQCVDCVNGYIRDVLGLPIIEWTNAIDFKNKANGNYDIVYNDLNNLNLVPDVGDIVVYKSPDGIGHICVCIKKGTSLTFGAFEENWPVGSPCKSVLNKKYILGKYVVDYWMKPKKSIIESDMTDEQKRILDFIGNRTEGQVREAFGALNDLPSKDKQIQTLQSRVLDLEKSQKDLGDRLIALESNIQADLGLIEDWQKATQTANKQKSQALEQLEAMTSEKNKYKGYYETALKDQVNKYTGWQLIRKGVQLLIKKSK